MTSYTVTDLGTGSFYGLNDLGQAIGIAKGSTGTSPADQLLYTNGQVANLGQSIRLIQTNASGQMIAQLPVNGTLSDPNHLSYVLRGPDGLTQPIPGIASGDVPVAINDRGQVLVGKAINNTTATYAVLTDGQREATTVSAPNVPFVATALGPNGEVSGFANIGGSLRSATAGADGHFQGFRVDDGHGAAVAFNNTGQFVTANQFLLAGNTPETSSGGGLLYSDNSQKVTALFLTPRALNDAGQVVGSLGSGRTNAGLVENGLTVDLNTRLASTFRGTLTDSVAINNVGQILTTGSIDGINHSFLLTPETVPEPSSWLIAIGLLGVAVVRRRALRAG